MQRLWDAAERDYRARLLSVLPTNFSGVLLDLGCDDGAWTDELRRRLQIPPEHVQGLELVPERAELARARGFDVRVGDLDARWPFDDGAVDLVHANQVLEHVHRLDHFAGEVLRVLRPGGRAVVCTENLASWHNVAALALGYQPFSLTNVSNVRPIGNRFALHAGEPPGRSSWQHVHVLTLTALRDLFDAHGFAVEEAWASGYHPLPGRLARLDPRHGHFIGLVVRPCS
ncbi:MAG TPA: class I SAM-dependent methyltransferase [Gaiellaceae bacterium]|jgi:SAM-dependent methyltransferase|nr:class I SAM-dependent methyltransferase [Gaiellaceae bacterium]